ncbi:hypothetical protein QBC41DRAFT_304707 [Cercophora samala]|uniref:N-acetyltransferase domain-containing protein n=1 Tax=Cercophora samala TaxID=330535 RepID=A0AA40DAS9_9PEZI|nr:hypothetical protein QBC41DRAFT_304707 [Cercophora samala]
MSITIRPALKDDLDAISKIAAIVAPHTTHLPYIHPGEYLDEYCKHLYDDYHSYIRNAPLDKYMVMVAEIPNPTTPLNPQSKIIIAFAVWSKLPKFLPHKHEKTTDLTYEEYTKANDDDKSSTAALQASLDKSPPPLRPDDNYDAMDRDEGYWKIKFGTRQITLIDLSTSPDYWRRGAATKLLEWGMKLARRGGKAIKLISTPFAKALFAKHGFKEMGNLVIQLKGEDEKLVMPSMVWDPKDEIREEEEAQDETNEEKEVEFQTDEKKEAEDEVSEEETETQDEIELTSSQLLQRVEENEA